jgi:hypothetical protein
MREIWDRQLGESPEAYRQFVWWRDQSPRPPPSDFALARLHDWHSRAVAWDAMQQIPQDRVAQLDYAVSRMIRVIAVEITKLERRALTSPEPEVELKQIGLMTKRVAEVIRLLRENAPQGTGVDVCAQLIEESGLTVEQSRAILQLFRS